MVDMAGKLGWVRRIANTLIMLGLPTYLAGTLLDNLLTRRIGTILATGGILLYGGYLLTNYVQMYRRGEGCVTGTYLNLALWSVSPRGLYEQFKQLVGEVRHRGKAIPQIHGRTEISAVDPPIKGCWVVLRGGVEKETSHSWGLVSQRYAYDLIRLEDREKLGNICGYRMLNDWVTYGSEVVSALEGEVVDVVNRLRDNEPVGRMGILGTTLPGNYVVVKHDEGLYSLYAHLKRGGVAVEVGDYVDKGDLIGYAGNSGVSTLPHLHFQLMKTPNIYSTVSLPIKMRWRIDGEEVIGYPRTGDVICG